jgi:hypothetical protein
MVYCSFECRALDGKTVRASVAKGLVEIAAYKEEHEVLTRRETAKYLRLGEAAVSWYEQQERLPVFARRADIPGRGKGVVFYKITEVKRLRQELLGAWRRGNLPHPALVEQYGSEAKNRWFGRMATQTAEQSRKAVGMPAHRDQSRIRVDDAKQARIIKLAAQGHSQRGIAAIVGVSRGSVEHVLRKKVA